jgi:hypothetical protein
LKTGVVKATEGSNPSLSARKPIKKSVNIMAEEEQVILSWRAPEFQHYPKNTAWYITLFLLMTLIIFFFILQKDIFGAICIFIFGVFVFIFSRQRPRIVAVNLTTAGVAIDETFIPYKSIKHFWVVYNEHHRTLNLETTAYLNRTLIVQFPEDDSIDPRLIRDVLVQAVPEHEETEPTLAQKVMHRLKF